MDNNEILHPYLIKTKDFVADRSVLFLTPDQKELLGIHSSSHQITVCAGHQKVLAQVLTLSQPDNVIQVTSDIITKLGLFSGISLNVIASGPDLIWFGPIVAIMISNSSWHELLGGHGARELTAPEKWCRTSGYFTYFFTCHEILWNHRMIKGCFFHPVMNRWEVRWFPFPDTVYDQATSRSSEDLLNLAKTNLKRFNKYEALHLINQRRFFGKYETAECLSFFEQTRDLVPKSSLITTVEDLTSFLKRWEFVYIKGEYDSFGQQVTRVIKTAEGYQCDFGGKSGGTALAATAAEVLSLVRQRYGNAAIMVQQGIDLAVIDERKFDLRVIVQKNNSGQWNMSLVSARFAPAGVATDISSSGEERILKEKTFSDCVRCLTWNQLSRASINCAAAIESHFGPHGEIGLDFGLDKENKLWVFEANSKPSTINYLDLAEAETSLRLHLQPFTYAEYLLKNSVEDKLALKPKRPMHVPMVMLSQEVCREIKVPRNSVIEVKAGLLKQKVIAAKNPVSDAEQDRLSLAKLLNLTFPVDWDLRYDQKTLILGPVKAIMVNEDIFLTPEALPALTEQINCPEKGLLYICSANDMNPDSGMAAGYQLKRNADNSWQWSPGLFPMPD